MAAFSTSNSSDQRRTSGEPAVARRRRGCWMGPPGRGIPPPPPLPPALASGVQILVPWKAIAVKKLARRRWRRHARQQRWCVPAEDYPARGCSLRWGCHWSCCCPMTRRPYRWAPAGGLPSTRPPPVPTRRRSSRFPPRPIWPSDLRSGLSKRPRSQIKIQIWKAEG